MSCQTCHTFMFYNYKAFYSSKMVLLYYILLQILQYLSFDMPLLSSSNLSVLQFIATELSLRAVMSSLLPFSLRVHDQYIT